MSGHLYIRNEPVQAYVDRIIDEAVDKKLKSMSDKYIGKPGQVCQLQSDGTMKWVDYAQDSWLDKEAWKDLYKARYLDYWKRWITTRDYVEKAIAAYEAAMVKFNSLQFSHSHDKAKHMRDALVLVHHEIRALEGVYEPKKSNAGFGLDYF